MTHKGGKGCELATASVTFRAVVEILLICSIIVISEDSAEI